MVFKVSSLDRIQLRFVAADRVYNPVPCVGGLSSFRPGRFSSASFSHSPGAVDEAFTGFFRTFPQIQKSAKLGPPSGSELPAESSPSTWRACVVPMVPEEDESEPETESESEVEEDSEIWVDEAGRQWMRTAAFPGRWYLLGTSFDGAIWWDEPG